jgi:tetraacyldisaccharide 4'-kinase
LIRSGDYYRGLVSGERRGPWPGLLRGALRGLSLPYGLAMRVRNRLYEGGWKASHRAGVPVVSVGNLTVGGTGKTPCVEYVARFYRQRELRVAVLSRGYGGQGGRNDEALVLEENLPDVPHLQGADRVALARIAALELESEVLVLDDGLQHRRLARDLDIVLIDATLPWGHGYLLPRGLLREPPAELRRAGVVVLSRVDQVEADDLHKLRRRVATLAPSVPVAETRHRPLELVNSEHATRPVEDLKDRPVAAFCGIGNAGAFRSTLDDLGAKVTAFRRFPDHYAYVRADVEDLRAWARKQDQADMVITTQKDLVKLCVSQLGGQELWAVRIGLHFEAGQDAFDHKLQDVIRGVEA